jgi:Ferredoxin thioredoxin reductase variable alpha chain
MEADAKDTLTVGTRVRIKSNVLVYHHPEHRGQAFDIQGLTGEITSILLDWHGKEISANYPYLVKFDGKFTGHFQASEFEVVS